MSTAVAAAPPPPPMSATLAPMAERNISPRQFAAINPSTSTPPSVSASHDAHSSTDSASRHSRDHPSPSEHTGRSSPKASSSRSGPPPMIKVKKEPGSPGIQSARHRPKRLDLSSSTPSARGPQAGGRPSAPLTSRESAGLAIQDVGLACLSPGFQTNDPGMREQLQRSLDVRDQQRQIIEARQKGGKPITSHENGEGSSRPQDTALFSGNQARTPGTSRRKGPPAGLSINAPSAAHFANDRVIQSAPLHQTFTGLRPDQPYSRHVQHGPSGLSQTSHIHHLPATQTNNRLPPISDVFANDRLDPPRNYPTSHSPGHSSHSNVPPPIPSPGFPPPHHHQHQPPVPLSGRPREFRSAEEAVQGLSGGRDELMPKLVHYGGVQPPTPPSELTHANRQHAASGAQQTSSAVGLEHPPSRPELVSRSASISGRRRAREEYERDNGSPPSIGRPQIKRTTFTLRGEHADRDEDWRSSMGGAEKREEFLRLCERAWDLFHS